MTISPGTDQARDTPGSPQPRELTLIEALRAQRFLNKRARQCVDGPAFVVWSVLLDSTLGFQNIRAKHFHAYLAAEANVTTKTVSRAVKTLVAAGLIEYEPGTASEVLGKNVPSQFTILNVREVLADWSMGVDSKGVPPRQGVPPSQSPPVPPDEGGLSSPARGDGPDSPVPPVPPEESTYRGENLTGKNLMGNDTGVGAEIVPLKPDALPAPVRADAKAVLDAYCAARVDQGTPVARPAAVKQGIQDALKIGYSARAVMVGMGMWEAEGHLSPRQIPEWVEKAARQGPEPVEPMSVPDLLAEGRARYTRFLARKAVATPSKAEVRRQRSLSAIRDFIQ